MRFANDRKISLATLFDTYSAEELNEWIAYDLVIGLNDPHYDACMIAMTIANVNGNKLDITDFLRRHKPKNNVKSQLMQQAENLKAFANRNNSIIIGEKKGVRNK